MSLLARSLYFCTRPYQALCHCALGKPSTRWLCSQSMRRISGPDLTAREAAYLHKYKQGHDVEAAAAADDDEQLVLAAATAAYNVWRAVALSACGIGGLFFLVFILRSK